MFKYGFNDRVPDHPAGKLLGGSSAINGAVFTPLTRAGIDAWAQLGNSKWDWESLRPCLQRSYTLHAPESSRQLSENGNDPADGPIQVVFPALDDKKSNALCQAWKEAFRSQGYDYSTDILAEKKTIGTRDYMATIDPTSGLRSSADNEYGRLASQRPNVRIITGATVHRIHFVSASNTSSSNTKLATGAEFSHDGAIMNIYANKEVILAAGVFHTPKLLEL